MQMCHNCVTMVLHWYCAGTTLALHWYCDAVILVLQWNRRVLHWASMCSTGGGFATSRQDGTNPREGYACSRAQRKTERPPESSSPSSAPRGARRPQRAMGRYYTGATLETNGAARALHGDCAALGV